MKPYSPKTYSPKSYSPVLDQSQTDFYNIADSSASPFAAVQVGLLKATYHSETSFSPESPLSPVSPASPVSPVSPASPVSPVSPVSSVSHVSPASPSCAIPSFAPRTYVNHEDSILNNSGYQTLRTLRTTQQGELVSAAIITPSFVASKRVSQKAVIKTVSKSLHSQHIARSDPDDEFGGITYCIPNNIVKEAFILKYLTFHNRCVDGYINRFVDFFHSKDKYYLVLRHIDDNAMNLKAFVDEAHRYIQNGQLDIAIYLQTIKYLFWQLLMVFHWMHDEMNCCHLDLKLEHVMLKVKGALPVFIIDPKSNSVTIRRGISVRLCDFGSAELFRDGVFICSKTSSVLREVQYQSPLLVSNETYDARKADVWALGSMLVHCLIGRPLYRNVYEHGYKVINTGKIKDYLKLYNLKAHVRSKSLDLLQHMLQIDEDERYHCIDILKHKWFRSYYKKYKELIDAPEKPNKLKNLPYYNL
eukprot:1058969_1